MTKNLLKNRIFLSVGPWLVCRLMQLWFGTVRMKIINENVYEEYFKLNQDKGNVIAAFWHRNAIFFLYFFRKLDHRILMISQSRDGEFLARIGRRLGYHCQRGSSTRGGSQALKGLIENLKAPGPTRFCGTAVDGPQGPARQLKKGLLLAAKKTGASFIPIAWSGARVITFSKTWDKTIIPLPFSKIVMAFHQPVVIPPDVSKENFDQIFDRTEKTLNELTDTVDKLAGYRISND